MNSSGSDLSGQVDPGRIVGEFEIAGRFVEARPYGSGHINDTFEVRTRQASGSRRYILQRINHSIFRDIPALMDNIVRVTEHIRAKCAAMDPTRQSRCTLNVIPARDGAFFFKTGSGDYWRAYDFIEGARTYDVIEDDRQAEEAGYAFAVFQKALADLPEPPLVETIRHFHDTPVRFNALENAVMENAAGRVAGCMPEINFAMGMREETSVVMDGLAAGLLPWRVTHNDTKINNVMLDERTGEGVCVIDLDTVMPGSVLYDFGDQVRTSTGHFDESERDLSRVFMDLARFERLVRGYLRGASSFLVEREKDLLAFSGILITFEIGIRFLADYLQGDVYFKTSAPDQNLVRARTQFAFVRDMRAKSAQMQEIVDKYRT